MALLSNWLHHTSFRRQLLLAVVLGVLSTVLLSAIGSSWQASRQIRQTLLEQGGGVAENLARQSKLALLFDSVDNAAGAVDTTLNFPDVIRVEIVHANGRVLLSRGKDDPAKISRPAVLHPESRYAVLEEETDDAWHFISPVYAREEAESPFDAAPRPDELLGYVRIVQSKATLQQMLRDIMIVNFAIALLFTLLFLVTIALLTRRLTRPLTELSDAMARAERGEPTVRANIAGPRDIGEMAHAFNSMMSVLEERERELRATRDEALKFARLKSEFAATVSHEIRTPLNGVIGTLDMLMATNLPARQRQFIGIAWNSAHYLLDLVNNILDFSKLEAGKLELERGDFDIYQLVEEVIELLAPQANQKGLELGYVAVSDVPKYLAGDARRVRQILVNLVGNAIKFTETGEVGIRLNTQATDRARPMLCIDVTDTGIGVPDEARARIFDSFTQADPSTTRRYTGSGLGLAICRQLVALMGGEIGVEHRPERGSRFWFTLPLELAVEPALQPRQPRRALGAGRRVLIVEESAIVCDFLRQSLETWGYTCRTATTTDDAFGMMRQAVLIGAPFAVVIFDTVFATAAGGEMPVRVRTEPMLRGTRLILMNRYGADDPATTAQADAYLSKPLRLDRVLECIAAVTGNVLTSTAELVAPESAEDSAARLHRVLIVEDNHTNQTVARAMLGMLGCQSEIAENGHGALRAYERQPWDLILMDCNMPDMDGYEVTRIIRTRELERGRRTPIVAMTANTQPTDVERCRVAGMDDHLGKPLTINSLAAKIKRWIPGHPIELAHMEQASEFARPNVDARAGEALDPAVFGKLREMLGRGLGQMIRPFLEDMPRYIGQMQSAAAAGDADQLRRAAHAIKGAASNLGAEALTRAAREIEERAQTGHLGEIESMLAVLDQEHERVKLALRAERTDDAAPPPMAVEHGALVLVVDDDRSTRSALRYALQRGGFRIEEAADGVQALAVIDRIRPDVILMDALMPNMDGFSACAKLQEMPYGKDIPLLMITALDDKYSIERAFAAGASDYISKPLHLSVVNQRVRRIVEATRAHRHVRHLAYNDVLTGLPNRALFTDYLNQAIARAQSRDQSLAVLFLDLDRFKFVNDTLGHEIGDRLLKSVALRIQQCVRGSDCVARLGGDEFTIVLEELPSVAAASNTAQKICRALATPFEIESHDIFVSGSIGISLYPSDGTDASTLLRHADTAMYRAKKDNTGFHFYEAGMEVTVSEHLRMENALRHALDRKEFVVHYQPIADTASGKFIGAEALVRWRHPARGLVSPSEFIALAEETGLIIPLGEWVLRNACEQGARWIDAGLTSLRLSVNLSGIQLKQGRFIETLEQILRQTGLPPGMLTLEITESVLMEHARETEAALQQLRDVGVTLAIDDFGTGYSSLAYLRRFPVQLLKIDRAFTGDVTTNPDDAAIVTGMIALAHSLRLKVVAEGVENHAQRDFLARLNCDYIQGHYLSEPLPADTFEQRILAAHFPDNIFAKRGKRDV